MHTIFACCGERATNIPNRGYIYIYITPLVPWFRILASTPTFAPWCITELSRNSKAVSKFGVNLPTRRGKCVEGGPNQLGRAGFSYGRKGLRGESANFRVERMFGTNTLV